MKRRAVIGLLLIVFFLLESSVFPMLNFLSATPNLLLILTCAIGFMQGKKEGLMTGFVSGLLVDITFGEFFGINALVFLMAGYISGFFTDVFFDEDVRIPLFLVTVGDLFLNVVMYFSNSFLEGRFAFGSYFVQLILPEIISTVLFTLIFYRLIYRLNHSLVEREKKGKQSLWIRD